MNVEQQRAIAMANARKRLADSPGAELTAPSGENFPISSTREAPMGARAGASIKMTPHGQLGFYQDRFGKANVVNTEQGIYIIDPKSKMAYPADSPELNMKDLADFGGEGLQTAPTLFSAGNPVAVGALAAAGNAGRQAISSMLPGDDQMDLGDRAASVGVDAALGGAAQFGVNKLVGGLNAVRPRNIGASVIGAAENKPFAGIGRAVENESGVVFTPGQRTGSRTLLTVEGMLRRNPASADVMFQGDIGQLEKSLGYLDRTMGSFSSRPADAASLGDSVTAAVTKATEDALSLRTKVGNADFGRARLLSGDKMVMPVDDTVTVLDDIINGYDVPGGGDATAALVNQLKGVRAELVGEPVKVNQLQRLLEVYGKAAVGKGNIFKDMDRSQQMAIAKRVFGALNRDLDTAANAAANDNAGTALRAARDRYKANSQLVNEISDSAIARLLGREAGETPEIVAERVLKMPGSQIQGVLKIAQKSDPELAGQIKRAWMERALEKGGVPRGDAPPVATPDGNIMWSPKKVATSLRESPLWSALDKGEQRNMNYVMQLLDRLGDRAGTDGSPTAPLQQAWELVKSGVSGAAWPFLYALGARRLAQSLVDPAGQKALAQVILFKPGKKTAMTGALSYFGALMAADGNETTHQLVSQPDRIEPQPLRQR